MYKRQLLIGVFALVWSMNRHLKKIPASFDEPEGDHPVKPPEVRGEANAPGDPDDNAIGELPRESDG